MSPGVMAQVAKISKPHESVSERTERSPGYERADRDPRTLAQLRTRARSPSPDLAREHAVAARDLHHTREARAPLFEPPATFQTDETAPYSRLSRSGFGYLHVGTRTN